MKILNFLKNDIVLTISGILAVISAFFVPPDMEYISYINLPVLVLLFCLMLVVAGFKSAGAFDVLKSALSRKIKSEKAMIFSLTMICFFTSALITNDVALITFVPFSIAMLKNQKSSSVIFCVVMETIAANLGSLITPIGNPQNLFLYTYYGVSIGEFFRITLPLGAICFAMICVCFLLGKNTVLNTYADHTSTPVSTKHILVFGFLFALCILSVLKLVSCYITLLVVIICVFFANKKLFSDADYILLITFVFFFIFAGNIARIPTIYTFIENALAGREVVVSALISQVISNVPAAAMLASFTDNARSLILGTNIGGLGTLIASMASLISYRFIAGTENIGNGKYMLTFSAYNFLMLFILLIIF